MKMPHVAGVAATAALCLLTSSTVHAQEQRAVHWTTRAVPGTVRGGDTIVVSLRAKIDEFFHLYSTTQPAGGPVRTTVTVLPNADWTLVGAMRAPAPDTIPDGNFGIMSEVYDDSVAIGLTLHASALPSSVPRVAVRYQACTARYCLPPRTDTLSVAVSLASTLAAAKVDVRAAAPSDANRPSAERAPEVVSFGGADGVKDFLLLAASMGALALLTPCVFPMIPITVTSFIAVADDRRRGLRLAALYALGIVGSFTGLGVLAAALFGASGLARFSANPWVNLSIAALFTLFGLSLAGVVHLALPASLVTRASSAKFGREGLGTVFMGVVFTLTAFTCTAPFVGTLLVMSAQGNWTWPLVGMLVFSTVFASPFVLLALVPGLLRRRPRAGDWMPALELTVGVIEIGAAIKFASNADLVLGWNVLTRPVVILLWIALLCMLAGALLVRAARWSQPHAAQRRSRFRLAIGTASVAAALMLIPGLFGHRLGELDAFLPPLPTREDRSAGDRGELAWTPNDYSGALVTASRDRRPVLIDFTGYTCTNCRWMEANMFPRPEIRSALGQFVRLRLYTDGLGEPYRSQQALEQRLFGTVALPYYAILDADGRPRATFLGMTRNASQFREFLARGLPTAPTTASIDFEQERNREH